jgi:hypothetical protein
MRALPRDYARCNGIGGENLICDRRESCLRYQEPELCYENYSWFMPNLVKGESGCEEYIGKIDYTNWKGDRAIRNIIPLFPYFAANEYHPDKQWLLKAWDIDKRVMRSFALKGINKPRFTKYKRENFGGWDLEFPDWFMCWEWEVSEKYGREWGFSIKKLVHTYNDSRLPDTLFCVGKTDVFTWLPARVNFNTPFKEFDWLGINVGILIKNIFSKPPIATQSKIAAIEEENKK